MFTALHSMQRGLGYCQAVRLSVRLSNAWFVTKRKHLAKKSSIITNRKSTKSFPVSLRWTACVAHKLLPQRWLKSTNLSTVLRNNGGFLSKKVCYKVSNFQRKSYKVFTGLSPCTHGWWGTSFSTWNFGPKWHTPSKTATSNRYSLIAPQP